MKKRSLKVTLCLLMTAVLLLPILGGAAAAKANQPVTISFWSIFPSTDPKRGELEALIDQFEKENPGIKVAHTGYSFWDYFGKIRVAQAGGADPDISFNDNSSVKVRAASGIIKNLQPFIEKDDFGIGEFSDVDREICSYGGDPYAVMFSSDFRLLYYNKDHFRAAGLDPEKPPATVAELVEYAEKLDKYETLTVGSTTVRKFSNLGFHPTLGNNSFYTDVWNMGGEFFTPSNMPNFNDPTVRRGLKQYTDLCQRYTQGELNMFVADTSSNSTLDPFIQGKVSMEVNGDWFAWDMQYYKDRNPDNPMYDIDYGVAPYPYEEGHRTSYGNGFTLEMSNRTEGAKADAAYKLLSFFARADVQQGWVEKFQYTPSNRAALQLLLDDPEVPNLYKQIFAESKYKKSPDVCADAPEWWGYVTPEITNMLNGKITFDEMIDTIQSGLMNKITHGGKPDALVLGIIVGIVAFTAAVFIITGILSARKNRKTKKEMEARR